MFDSLGAPELLIILAVILLLFGVGRIGNLGKELGTAIREFREGLKGGAEESPDETGAEMPTTTIDK